MVDSGLSDLQSKGICTCGCVHAFIEAADRCDQDDQTVQAIKMGMTNLYCGFSCVGVMQVVLSFSLS